MGPKSKSQSKAKGHATKKVAEKAAAKKAEQAPKASEEVPTSQPEERALVGGGGVRTVTQDVPHSQATEESGNMPLPLTQPRANNTSVDSASELTEPDESKEEDGGVLDGDMKGMDVDAEGETDDQDGGELAVEAGSLVPSKVRSSNVTAEEKGSAEAEEEGKGDEQDNVKDDLMEIDGDQAQEPKKAVGGVGEMTGEGMAANLGKAREGASEADKQEQERGGTDERARDEMDVDKAGADDVGGARGRSTTEQEEPLRPPRRVPGTRPRGAGAGAEASSTVTATAAAPAPAGASVTMQGAASLGASAKGPSGAGDPALDEVESIKRVKKSGKKKNKEEKKEASDKKEIVNSELNKLWYDSLLGYSTVPCVDDAGMSTKVPAIKAYDHLQRKEVQANVDKLAAKGLSGLMRMATDNALEVIVDPDVIDPNSYHAQASADLPILASAPGVEHAEVGMVAGFHRRAALRQCWEATDAQHRGSRVWTPALEEDLKNNGCWMVRVWNKKVLESSPCGSAIIQILRSNNKTQEMKDQPARRTANLCRALINANEVGAKSLFSNMIVNDKTKTAFDIVLGNLPACRWMLMYLACISQYTASTYALETYFEPDKWEIFGPYWGEILVHQPGISVVFSRILAVASESLPFFKERVDFVDKASVLANNERLADLYSKLTPTEGITSHRLTEAERVFVQLLSDAAEYSMERSTAADEGFAQSLTRGVLTGWRENPAGVKKMRVFYAEMSAHFDMLIDADAQGPKPTVTHPELVKTAFYNICMSQFRDEDGLGPLCWNTGRLPLACPRVVRSILDEFTSHTRLGDASTILTFIGNVIAPGSVTLNKRIRPRANKPEQVEHTPLLMVCSFIENIRRRQRSMSREGRTDDWDKETRAVAERVACRIADGVLAFHGSISVSDVVKLNAMNKKYTELLSVKDGKMSKGDKSKGNSGVDGEDEALDLKSLGRVYAHLDLLVDGWNDMCLLHTKELRLESHPTVSNAVMERYNGAKGKLPSLDDAEDKLMRRAAHFLTVFPVDPFKTIKGTGTTHRKQSQEYSMIPCAIQYAALSAELLTVLHGCPLLVRLYDDICVMLADDEVLGEGWLPWPKMDTMRPTEKAIDASATTTGNVSGTPSRTPSPPPAPADLVEIPEAQVIIESNLRNRATSLDQLPSSLARDVAKVYQDCQQNTTRGNYTLSQDMIDLLKLVNKQAVKDTYRFYGGAEAHGVAMRAKEEGMNKWLDNKVKALTEEEAKMVEAAVQTGVSDEVAAREKKEKAAEKKRSASTSAKDGGPAKRIRTGKKAKDA